MVRVEDVAVVDLDQALQDPNSPFKACKPFLSLIKKHAWDHGST